MLKLAETVPYLLLYDVISIATVINGYDAFKLTVWFSDTVPLNRIVSVIDDVGIIEAKIRPWLADRASVVEYDESESITFVIVLVSVSNVKSLIVPFPNLANTLELPTCIFPAFRTILWKELHIVCSIR